MQWSYVANKKSIGHAMKMMGPLAEVRLGLFLEEAAPRAADPTNGKPDKSKIDC